MANPPLIRVKIDVLKVLKEALYKGQKGTYLTLNLWETPGGQYGDFRVTQDLGKDRRGEKTEILGNAEYVAKTPGPTLPPVDRPTRATPPPSEDDADGMPF